MTVAPCLAAATAAHTPDRPPPATTMSALSSTFLIVFEFRSVSMPCADAVSAVSGVRTMAANLMKNLFVIYNVFWLSVKISQNWPKAQ